MIATIAYILLIIILITEIGAFFKKIPPLALRILLLVTGLLLLAETVYRSVLIQFPALTNTFEALIFFSAFILFTTCLLSFWKKEKLSHSVIFIGTILAFLLLSLASSPLVPYEVNPPVPALRSAWLVLHVALSFVGESFFALGFAASLYYFFVKDSQKKENADKLIYTVTGIGYPIFTIGALIFGSIWAQFAWGSFWSWDPKETFALITWLVYTIYLHLRLMTKTPVKITILVVIIGFMFTLFTFFGVNYLLPGLHSYK